jgi:elongation factor G
MDRLGADFEKCVDMIRERLGAVPLPIQMPIGSGPEFSAVVDLIRMQGRYHDPESLGAKYEDRPIPENAGEMAELHREDMLHTLAEHSDGVMEKYLEEQPIGEDELMLAIREATIAGRLIPVLCGASLRNMGVQNLLDAVCDFLPSPLDVPSVRGIHPKTGESVERKATEKGHFFSLVFKVASDEHGDLFYLRIYSGQVAARQQLLNSRTGQRERVTQLFRMYADERAAIRQAVAGDIVAAAGLKTSATGDTLCDPRHPVSLETMEFPDTVISMAIEPRTSADRGRLDDALSRLEREDPTFRRHVDPETGQTIISGMGELHLQVLKHRMLADFHVAANVGKPRVSYKETIRGPAECEGRYDQALGGRPQYAHVALRLEPMRVSAREAHGEPSASAERPSARPKRPATGERAPRMTRAIAVEFHVGEDEIPRAFRPAVEEGIQSAGSAGVLAGYAVTGVRAIVTGGSSHPTDSTEGAFSAAAARAFRDGAERAGMVLLEPWMRFEVMVPEAHLGDVLTDLNARRAEITEQGMRSAVHVLEGRVPLSEMFGYATALRSLTQGRATFTMEPVAYLPVPDHIMESLLL